MLEYFLNINSPLELYLSRFMAGLLHALYALNVFTLSINQT